MKTRGAKLEASTGEAKRATELSEKEIQDKAGMGVGKVEQVASIDAQATTPPDAGSQYDVMLNMTSC